MTTNSLKLEDLIKRHGFRESLLDLEVSQDQILMVSGSLENWKKLARAAGLSEPEIIEIEHGEDDESSRRYKTLHMWHKKNAFLATYSKLLSILLHIGRADIAQEVCIRLKEDSDVCSSITGKISHSLFAFLLL